MFRLNLPPYPIKIQEKGEKRQIFDFLRRKWVALTPEEWVRQHFTHYLAEQKGYPQSLLANEVELRIGDKLRLPGFLKKALYTMTEKTVNDIFNKNDFSDASVMKTVVAVREYNRRLGFSQKWITDFVYKVVMLAKKEPRPSGDEK